MLPLPLDCETYIYPTNYWLLERWLSSLPTTQGAASLQADLLLFATQIEMSFAKIDRTPSAAADFHGKLVSAARLGDEILDPR